MGSAASGSGEEAIRPVENADREGPHPALVPLSGALGREASAFSRRYRYAGLGLIQLVLSRGDHELDE
jgi:hypothetical protein